MWSPSADSFSDPGSIPGTSTINSRNPLHKRVSSHKNRPCDKLRQKNFFKESFRRLGSVPVVLCNLGQSILLALGVNKRRVEVGVA